MEQLKPNNVEGNQVILEISGGGPISVGASVQLKILSESFLHQYICEGTIAYQTKLKHRPNKINITVVKDKKVLEDKTYLIDWKDNETFQLLIDSVEVEGNFFDFTPDIEDLIKEEARQGKIKAIKQDINKALDSKDQEEFLRLTDVLLQIQENYNQKNGAL